MCARVAVVFLSGSWLTTPCSRSDDRADGPHVLDREGRSAPIHQWTRADARWHALDRQYRWSFYLRWPEVRGIQPDIRLTVTPGEPHSISYGLEAGRPLGIFFHGPPACIHDGT